MKKDDTLSGSVACIQNGVNKRELDVKISYHHATEGQEEEVESVVE